MKQWGLGIEHEMRIRFENKLSEKSGLNLDENIDDHIFINSKTLLYFFNIYETTIMKDFNKYVDLNIKKYDAYYNTIILKNQLLDIIYKNGKYPFQNNIFYNLSTDENIKRTKNLIDFYINHYTLNNSPLLFFNYNFNNDLSLNIKSYIGNDYYKKELIYLFNNLYNHEYEKNVLKYLKLTFDKFKVKKITFTIEDNNISINFEYFNNNDEKTIKPMTFNDFINKINDYILHLKNHIKYQVNLKDIDLNKFYKNLFLLYFNNLPEIDYTARTSALEFKTIQPLNVNYEDALRDLIDLEETFIYLVNCLYIFQIKKNIYGENLIYHNIGSLQNSYELFDIINGYYNFIEEDYTGSYHIWITCPYNSKMSMKDFIDKHIVLANKLQLIEPILSAHFSSPSYSALFNKKYSKSSLRQFLTYYSNYGTTDITLMRGVDKHVIDKYYLTENDILLDKPIIPVMSDKGIYEMNIYDNNGNKIINYDKLTTRFLTNNLYIPLDKGNSSSNRDEKIHVNNYLNMIFEKTNIKPLAQIDSIKYYKLGSDFRTRFLSNYFYPLDHKWETRLLMKNNKLIEVYYNKELNKISYERVYNRNLFNELVNNHRMGIEFRIFDHFPTHYLSQILSILCPIVIDSMNSLKVIKFKDTYITKQFWHNEMFNVLTNGFEYKVGKEYIKYLNKEFNIKINSRRKNGYDTENILKILNKELNNKYRHSNGRSIYKKLAFKTDISFESFNKIAWKTIISKYFDNNPDIYRKIMYKKNKVSMNDIQKIFNKNIQYDIEKIKKILF